MNVGAAGLADRSRCATLALIQERRQIADPFGCFTRRIEEGDQRRAPGVAALVQPLGWAPPSTTNR